jgi:phage shock protein A
MAESEMASFRDQVGKYESSTRAALGQGKTDLAREVAGRIAELESEIGTRGPLVENMKAAEARLRTAIASTDQKIETLRREIDIVKVNESVQRAQTSVALQSAGAHSRIGSAADSLQRIKQRQAVQEERLRVGQEFEDKRTGADLDAKLKEAGILPGHASADDVLARLSAQDVSVVTPRIGTSVPNEKAPG